MTKAKCKDINIIEYIEGKASKETSVHIDSCRKCKTEAEKLSGFLNIVSSRYTKGKKIDQELDKKLQSFNIAKMKKLPDTIAEKVEGLKKRSLKTQLKKAIGKVKGPVDDAIKDFLTPHAQPLPASPKDITKTGKKKKTKAKSKAKSKKRSK